MTNINDFQGLCSEQGTIDREIWLNNCRNAYDDAINAVNELGKTNEWRNLAQTIAKASLGCMCPVCYADTGEERIMSIDMAFPPAPPWVYDPKDPLEDMGLCMSCKECNHKTYVEFQGASEEDLAQVKRNLNKAAKRQKKKRRKRKR